jgi:hypothetical protein
MTTASTARPAWQKILIILLIVLGLLITLRFGMRAARSFGILRHRPFPPPMETDVELIRGWMTIPYIAHVYSVPDEVLWESLGVKPMKLDEARRTDLSHLNQQLFPGQPLEVMRRVKQAILDFQSHLPPPPPGLTPPPARTPAS